VQGCGLGLERLGLKKFFIRFGLVSVSAVQRLGLISVLRQNVSRDVKI